MQAAMWIKTYGGGYYVYNMSNGKSYFCERKLTASGRGKWSEEKALIFNLAMNK